MTTKLKINKQTYRISFFLNCSKLFHYLFHSDTSSRVAEEQEEPDTDDSNGDDLPDNLPDKLPEDTQSGEGDLSEPIIIPKPPTQPLSNATPPKAADKAPLKEEKKAYERKK